MSVTVLVVLLTMSGLVIFGVVALHRAEATAKTRAAFALVSLWCSASILEVLDRYRELYGPVGYNTVVTALRALENDGRAESWDSYSNLSPARGGRPRRMYRILDAGKPTADYRALLKQPPTPWPLDRTATAQPGPDTGARHASGTIESDPARVPPGR